MRVCCCRRRFLTDMQQRSRDLQAEANLSLAGQKNSLK
jgi:hypothetical protein